MTFDVIAEIEPPVEAGFADVHAQLGSLRRVASTFLVPDNHTGGATVSSLVVAGDIERLGLRAIACLNARDRNVLGLRRDLLTARYLGVNEVLLVHGDAPGVGDRAGALTVRAMLDECDELGVRAALTTRLVRLPSWKRRAARLFVQVAWSSDELMRWRDSVTFEGDVFAGVLVLPSAAMAHRLGERVPELRVPGAILDQLGLDPQAGVRIATDTIDAIRRSGAFAGVHLVSGVRHREVAAALARPRERTLHR